MIPILAETQLPDPSGYAAMGWVLAVLFALGGGLLILKMLTTRTPSLEEQFVTRKEFDTHVDDIKAKLKSIEDKGEARVIRIYDKIDDSADKTVDRIIELIRSNRK